MGNALVGESRIEVAEVNEARGRRREAGDFGSLGKLAGWIHLFITFEWQKIVVGY